MSDPQQPQVPPYASNAPQPPQAGYPTQQTPSPAPAPTAQHHYQGGAPQPQYAQPQYAQPAYASTAARPTDSNTPGKIGFIIGLVGLGLGLLQNVIVQIMIRSQAYDLINLISGVLSVIVFLAAAAALAFGIIGLKRVGAPHALAGIATGLGGAGVIGTGFSFIIFSVSSAFAF
ncbi:hypothetical protein [Microbacterium sp. TWP3-1-2b2]|uniref:hypothetical protein n=1 Tax=Microbacterium sp. TWP3-1-2b2 TaxID=2804651 RepID=UPI003CEB0475